MFAESITTPIDELMKIIEKTKKISVDILVKQIKEKRELVERWIMVLEEKGVIKIENKGLSSFVSINQENLKDDFDFFSLKNNFLQKAKVKEIPYTKLNELWQKFLKVHEKQLFLEFKRTKLKKGKILNTELDKMWKEFIIEFRIL
jgi:hypothetical protein